MSLVKNLLGMKFGRLTVIQQLGRTKSRHVLWECICDCGNVKNISSNALKKGTTLSCGCYTTEIISNNNRLLKTTHGLGTARVYNIWSQMKQRCNNPTNKNYKWYGEKGIVYCEKWEYFEGFWEDMKDGYDDNLTLDRIENNLGYFKENCRWATIQEQANNKTTNRVVEVNGVRGTVANQARKYGISPELALWRLKTGKCETEAFKPIERNKH